MTHPTKKGVARGPCVEQRRTYEYGTQTKRALCPFLTVAPQGNDGKKFFTRRETRRELRTEQEVGGLV